MIALNQGAKVSWNKLSDDLRKTWPHLPTPEDVKKEENTLAFDVGPLSVALGMMPRPIPRDSWAESHHRTYIWPTAAEELESHRTHLIATVIGDAPPLEQAKLLTMVTASLVHTCGAPSGVLWGEAGLWVSPQVFRELAVELLPDRLPLLVWLAIHIGKNENGTISGFTRGMQALDLMDFVTENSTDQPNDLMERFYGLAEYLIENGAVVKNGDTIGESASERIQVIYDDSPFGHEQKVMRLDYAAKKKRSWFSSRS